MTPTEPGAYLFRDAIGGEPQRVEVAKVGGEMVVRFEGMEPNERDDVLLADVNGDFQPVW